jgi:hypothetical protein
MDLKETGREVLDWIHLVVLGREEVLVNAAVNIMVP